MADTSLNAYIEEYKREGIGSQLYDLIYGVVRQVAWRYPPQVYSPNRWWDDDSLHTLTVDFIVERLFSGRLEYHLYSLESTSVLKKVLAREFRHFLVNQAHRSEYRNIYQRVKTLLTQDLRFRQAQEHSPFNLSVWYIGSARAYPQIQRFSIVLEVMFAYPLPLAIHYQEGKKLSPILSNDELRNLLIHTFQSLDGSLSVDLLMEALKYRLGLIEDTILSLDEPVNPDRVDEGTTLAALIASSDDVEQGVVTKELAESIFQRLTSRQRLVFVRWIEGVTLEQIGTELQVSKSTISNETKVITGYIEMVQPSSHEIEQICTHLHGLCQSDLH